MATAAKVPPGLSPSLLKREQTQDELRKAFEAELQNGKHRLRNVPGGVQVMPSNKSEFMVTAGLVTNSILFC